MFKNDLKFILCDTEPKFIAGIDHEDDSVDLRVVLFPETAVFALATHIVDNKIDSLL